MQSEPSSHHSLRAAGPQYYPLRPESDIGGEVYERMVLERLPSHGVRVVLGLPRDHRAGSPPPGWEVDVLNHRRGLHWTRAPLVFVPYVIRLLRAGRADLLRGHSVRYTGPSLLLGRALARSRVPVVLHHHHLYPRWARLEGLIASHADAVVTVSEHSKRALAEAGVAPGRIHVIPDGVARPPATGGCREAWPGAGLRLLYLGRLEAGKRPSVALDALAVLRRAGVDASLIIAGQGPLLAALAERAHEAGVADSVRFLGHVHEETKWRLYDSAEVLLFPSTLEGFGLVVAEAQSRGLTAVAAAGTATAEVLDPGHSGLLVASHGEAFAAAVRELADPHRRQAMAAHAARFARRFDWDACAAGVAGVYRELAGRPMALSSRSGA